METIMLKDSFTGSLFLVAFIAFLGPTCSSPSSIGWVNYGASCDAVRKCDRRAHLACDSDGVCTCIQPSTMIFEKASNGEHPPGKCVVKVGEPCKLALNVLDEDGREMFLKYPCTRNSECDTDGFCGCDSGFYETLNGTCSASQDYLEACDDDEGPKCNGNLGLECINGNCDCNPEHAVFESSVGQCVGLVGKSCWNGYCITNAKCQVKEGSTNGTKEICECQEQYYERDETCCVSKGTLGESCDVDAQCGSDSFTETKLICSEGSCKCDPNVSVQVAIDVPTKYLRPDPETQDTDGPYSVLKSICAPKAGLPCFEGHCAPLSNCKLDSVDSWYSQRDTPSPSSKTGGVTTNGTCECEEDLTVFKDDGTCRSSYGQICDADRKCLPPLVCLDGRCDCKYDIQFYGERFSFTFMCETKINGPCNSDMECPRLSHCELIYETSAGHCVCNEGYVLVPLENGDDECKKMFGEDCIQSDECDSVPALSCINGKCGCRSFSLYSHEYRKCLPLVGGSCNAKDEPPCTENAVCQRTHPMLRERCICPVGYYETGNYTCVSAPAPPGGVINGKEEITKRVGINPEVGKNGSQIANALEPLPKPIAIAAEENAGPANLPLTNTFTD